MIRGVRTAARQRLGSRAALGILPSLRISRRHFGVLSKLREWRPSFFSDSLCRPLFPALASLPAVAQAAAEESIETIAAASGQFSAASTLVATNPEAVKTFADIASTHFPTVRAFMHVMDSLHTAGLTWAGAIVVMTIGVRTVLVPVLIYSSRVGVRLTMMRPDLEELTADFNRKKALNVDAKANSADYSAGMMALYKKHRCNPLSPFVMPLFSMPLFISCFLALNGLCTEGVVGMSTGGALWFQDLTLRDPYFILPVVSSWSGVLILKRGSESGGAVDPKIAPMIKFMSVLGLLAPLVTHQLPSGVLVYFSAMSLVSLLQGEIIRADATRRLLGMPTLREMRIIKSVPGYTPFQADPGLGVPTSPDPKPDDSKKAEADAKDKKPARKKPLPLPFKKR